MEVEYIWYTKHGSPKRGYNRNGNYPLGRSIPRAIVKLKSSEIEVG
jgi:hypothetical protein